MAERQRFGCLHTWPCSCKQILSLRLPIRPHTSVKNARNMKSDSQAKLPYFERIFKIWTHEVLERAVLFPLAHQFCIPKSSCFMRRETDFFWKFWCCMRSLCIIDTSSDRYLLRLRNHEKFWAWNLWVLFWYIIVWLLVIDWARNHSAVLTNDRLPLPENPGGLVQGTRPRKMVFC